MDIYNNAIINIDSKIMKIGSSLIAPSLTIIFKGKGAFDDCGNYRPISITSQVSKTVENVVLFQFLLITSPPPPQFKELYLKSYKGLMKMKLRVCVLLIYKNVLTLLIILCY